MSNQPTAPSDFIRTRVADDVREGTYGGRVVTRFPPEPNGFLHIGHSKAILVNYGIAQEFPGALFRLRFDDTNPSTEETSYVEGMIRDIRWLGCEWEGEPRYTSDYFERLYAYALRLIERGEAFVCRLSSEEIAERRGTLTEAGTESPYRDRSIDENLEDFRRMRAGDVDEGAMVLRAKIDMGSPVLTMRDPILYRIQRAPHHRTGTEWPIYPMYDFAHCLSDAIEGVTHSLCSLEFADHRPLYDWILERTVDAPRPQQIEFARLNLSHTIMSKRLLLKLVETHLVEGWDDPRMPTLSGMRRRGYPAAAIRSFARDVGVARRENLIELARLEHAVREDLNANAPRVMGVLRPLKLVVVNYPEGQTEEFDAPNHPGDPSMGTRRVPFSREILIDRADFMEDPPKKFFRLAPGREVRLRAAYLVTCEDVIRDPSTDELTEVHCRYDPDSRGGNAADGRKVKGTIHWVSASHAIPAEVRLYSPLFTDESPAASPDNLEEQLSPDSLEVLNHCRVEPSLAGATAGDVRQFEREGYFCVDPDSEAGSLVFNRTVTLRDTWSKVSAPKKAD